MYPYPISLELTFAGGHAFRPLVINVFVAGTSAVLKPSTARSAATASTGFLERAAFGARHPFGDRRDDDGWGRADRHGNWRADY